MKAREKPHYVNNKEFSTAVVEYCVSCKEQTELGNTRPIIPNYIAQCFLRIAEGLSHKANFVRYTYREEMVMDAKQPLAQVIRMRLLTSLRFLGMRSCDVSRKRRSNKILR